MGLENYRLGAESSPPPIFVNQTSLRHNHTICLGIELKSWDTKPKTLSGPWHKEPGPLLTVRINGETELGRSAMRLTQKQQRWESSRIKESGGNSERQWMASSTSPATLPWERLWKRPKTSMYEWVAKLRRSYCWGTVVKSQKVLIGDAQSSFQKNLITEQLIYTYIPYPSIQQKLIPKGHSIQQSLMWPCDTKVIKSSS